MEHKNFGIIYTNSDEIFMRNSIHAFGGTSCGKKNNKEYTHEKLEKNIGGSRSPR